jgi:transcriptional regulator with XRE-family HTH domain
MCHRHVARKSVYLVFLAHQRENPICGCGRKRPAVPEARGSTGSPTVRRRELGALLRALRSERGLTVEQVAAELLCSPSKVSRMETGNRGATARDIRDLCRIYGVTDPAQQGRLTRLAAAGKRQGWWQGYELDYFATYVGLEEEAVALSYYQSSVVPGLLQTPAYVRAIHEITVPPISGERIDQLIEVRLTRQKLLTRDPPLQLTVVLDEAALHRQVGGPAVMKEQLERLVDLATWPNVTIQVIPFTAGAHAALESTFNILDFEAPAPSLVYVEGLVGFMYLERPQDLARYRGVFDQLRAKALTPQESVELISTTGVKYGDTVFLDRGR